MLPYSDEVVVAHLHQRQTSLMAEAATSRLIRQSRPQAATRLDRTLAVLGEHMVWWGERLQQRSRHTQEAHPA